MVESEFSIRTRWVTFPIAIDLHLRFMFTSEKKEKVSSAMLEPSKL